MPKIVDHDARRAEIVAATRRAIVQEGLDGATMRRIAAAASCTTGMLSHYFPSREAIVVAALRDAHRAAAARMEAAAAGSDPPAALRRVVLEALPLDRPRRDEWSVWLAFWSDAVRSEPLRAEHAARYREWRGLLTRLLRASGAADRTAADEAYRVSVLTDGLGLDLMLGRRRGAAARATRVVDEHLARLRLERAEATSRR